MQGDAQTVRPKSLLSAKTHSDPRRDTYAITILQNLAWLNRAIAKRHMYRKSTNQEIMEIRVLLVAPAIANIDSSEEMRTLSFLSNVRVSLLPGYVNRQKVYDAVQRNNYDIIHFAVHSNTEHLALNGDKLPPGDVGQIARLAKAKAVFFNSCSSGRLASYLVQRDIEFAIFANIDLPDADAWTMPVAFYEFLNRQIQETHTYSIPKAFNDAIAGNGHYGITSSYDRAGVLPLQRRVDRLEWMIWVLVGLGATHLLGTALFFLWWTGGA